MTSSLKGTTEPVTHKKITLDLNPKDREELERLAEARGQDVTAFLIDRVRKSGYVRFAAGKEPR